MLLYTVQWSADNDLTKGKGRVTSSLIFFSVLCRNSKDALHCLAWHFNFKYNNPKNLTLDDGEIRLTRAKIDSRGFNASYLYMDGIPSPIDLSDVKSSLHDISKHYIIHSLR